MSEKQQHRHWAATQEAQRRWGHRGVAIIGRRNMVGYFVGPTPNDPYRRPPFPWVKCGEGATWADAFAAADAEPELSEAP